jgi:hypothetical protein
LHVVDVEKVRAATLIHHIPALHVSQPHARNIRQVHHLGHRLQAYAVDGASTAPTAENHLSGDRGDGRIHAFDTV